MKKKENKQIKIDFGTSVTVLPKHVIGFVDKAKKFDLKVLLLIASSEKYREGKYVLELANELGSTEAEIENALAFWNGAGIISIGDAEQIQARNKTAKTEESPIAPTPRRAKESELPTYTTAELNALLEKNNAVVGLIDECQAILGKMFTASDIKVIMGLSDYLGLDNDYILVLMHFCARREVKSMRYIEKLAISCLDEGFTEASALETELYAREERESIEGKIKNVFGLGSRKLTTKEKKQVDAWINEYKFDLEVIEKAYEITVSATSKPSIHYANAILEKWNAEGIKTPSDVEALMQKREEQKAEEGSSFDVDDFFDAALKRSYSDTK